MNKNIITQTVIPINTAKTDYQEKVSINMVTTNEMGVKFQEMILTYYNSVKKQTKQSFNCALIAAIIGTAFFVYAIQKDESTILPIIAGAFLLVISSIYFYLYGKATRQFSIFYTCLETKIDLFDNDEKSVNSYLETMDKKLPFFSKN